MRCLLILFIASCAVSGAQVPADSRPATSNIMGAEYPRIQPDLRVTFRANAPAAQKAQLMPGGADNGLGKGPIDMVKDDKGIWTVTTQPAVPGFHYCWFIAARLFHAK